MKSYFHTFVLDDECKLWLWNGNKIRKGDKKEPNIKDNCIYVIRCNDKVLYVGETSIGVTRCLKGFHNNISETIAYKWRKNESLKGQLLECVIFKEIDATGRFDNKVERQALEAEVAWRVKNESGEWPLLLSKINPGALVSRDKTHKELINAIFSELHTRKWLVN